MKFAEYQDKFRDDIINLLSRNMNSNYAEARRNMWDWQYIENPFANKSGNGIVLLEEGNFAGFTGLMPVRIKYMGNIVEGYWER